MRSSAPIEYEKRKVTGDDRLGLQWIPVNPRKSSKVIANLAMSYQSLHIREGLTKIHRTANINHLTYTVPPSLPLSFQLTALPTDHYSDFFDGEDLDMDGSGSLADVSVSRELPSS